MPWDALQKYSAYIRILSVFERRFPLLGQWGPEAQFLTTLAVGPYWITEDERVQWCSGLLGLIQSNPHIRTLHLYLQWSHAKILLVDTQILRYLPNLRSLSLLRGVYHQHCFWSDTVLQEILDYCCRLERLSIDLYWEKEVEIFPLDDTEDHKDEKDERGMTMTRPMWTHMEQLYINDQPESRAIEIVERCPNLKSLKLRLGHKKYKETHQILQQMIQHHRSGYPSQLESIILGNMASIGQDQIHQSFLELLQLCPASFKTFGLHDSFLTDEITSTVLSFHGHILTQITLTGSPGIQGNQLHQFLSRCPNLTVLFASLDWEGWNVAQLVQSPWVCSETLQILHLSTSDRFEEDPDTEDDDSDMEEEEEDGAGVDDGLEEDEDEQDEQDDTQFSGTPDQAMWLLDTVAPQRQFWEQIGSITHLQRLYLNVQRSPFQRWSLSIANGGVENLARLDKLQEMRVPPEEAFMTENEKQALLQKRPWLRITVFEDPFNHTQTHQTDQHAQDAVQA
ncbi:hypothetical protein BGX31_009871 [Mortierella sp. GBA43]|nr:hypothetical protein BGX31_009871 [Mortierella sp. GBA43]